MIPAVLTPPKVAAATGLGVALVRHAMQRRELHCWPKSKGKRREHLVTTEQHVAAWLEKLAAQQNPNYDPTNESLADYFEDY